jgi:hypothetical protein
MPRACSAVWWASPLTPEPFSTASGMRDREAAPLAAGGADEAGAVTVCTLVTVFVPPPPCAA